MDRVIEFITDATFALAEKSNGLWQILIYILGITIASLLLIGIIVLGVYPLVD